MIGIIDYGVGNLFSVKNAFDYLRLPSQIVSSAREIQECDKLILPGVGAFREGMYALRSRNLSDIIKERVLEGVPLLGICLGMQLLFSEGDEGGIEPGLDIIAGRVSKFDQDLALPHVGWSRVKVVSDNHLVNSSHNKYFYFVHSYRASLSKQEEICGLTDYGETFPSIVVKDNIVGVQFHPEKSSDEGLLLLDRFGRYK